MTFKAHVLNIPTIGSKIIQKLKSMPPAMTFTEIKKQALRQ